MRLPQPDSSGGGATYFSVGVPIASPVTSPRESQRENDYFYTLVFPNTKAPSRQHDDEEIAGNGNRMRYSAAVATLRAVTAGGREREAAVVEELRAAWVAKFRTPPPSSCDTIPLLYFQELVRELVVQRFDSIPGLFMKTAVSLDEQSLLISFRPSKALLCATADRMHLAVAIMSEIDPGEQYWSKNPTRAAEESVQFSRQDAQEELYRMFLAGKISSEEAQIFDQHGDREDAGMWSRRIHALRRFFNPEVAKVVAEQEQTATPLPPTHLPFKDRTSMRYLYRHIDGGGDEPTPFRTVDKMRLTKAIIDGQFDCDALVEKRLLTHHFCMHTHHTDAVDTSIDVLRVQWGSLASPFRLYRQGLGHLSQMLHFQPIAHVRNYFGEEIALYFAYTSLYAQVLQLLVVVACATALLHAWGSVDGLSTNWYYVAFAVVNTAFVPSFLRKWTIRERTLTTEWGVTTLKDANATRPQFRGELATSYVTHRREISYSPRRRQLQQVASGALLLGLSTGLLWLDFSLITSSTYVDLASSSQLLMVHLAIAVFAKSLGAPLAALCTALTEWENYKTQPDYDANLTLKFAIVQSVNVFGVLWLQTFVLPLVSVHQQQLDCHQQAAHLLTTILSVDLVVSLVDLSLPVAKSLLSLLPVCPLLKSPASPDRTHLLVSSPPSHATVAMCAELALGPYEGVMFDYAQVAITFGFVAWFAALAPLTTLLAWAIAVLQIRVDAYKFCHLTQRPFPTQKNSIGSWATYLRVLVFGSWIHNAMLTVLYVAPLMSTSGLQDLSDFVLLHSMQDGADGEERRLATETLVLVVFASFAFISFLAGVHDQSDRAKLQQLHWLSVRRHFLENKYINNLDRVSDSIRDALPSGRVFLNGVHLYVVTGNKADEDAAEEVLDELADLKGELLGLQRQIHVLQKGGGSVGTLVVEIGSINILPAMDAVTKSVDALLQMQITAKSSSGGSSKAAASREASQVKNTSVVTSRSPVWSESHELELQSLDDTLLLRVFDQERLRKNRRIGHATLDVADVIATAPPILRLTTGSSSPTHETQDDDDATIPSAPSSPSAPAPSPLSKSAATGPVRMASMELALEIPATLLSSMQADLIKHGNPKLSLRCGVRLEPLGSLLHQQRKLQAAIHALQHREKQFFQWK